MNGIYPQIMQIDNHPQIAQMNADGWTSADCADVRRCTQMVGHPQIPQIAQMVGHPQIAQMNADGYRYTQMVFYG